MRSSPTDAPTTQALLNRRIWKACLSETEPDRFNGTISPLALANEYHDMERRARGIVAARPYLKDCGVSEPNTFFHLSVGRTTTVLTWTWCGSTVNGGLVTESQAFPTRLLDMTVDELAAWQAAQERLEAGR